MEKEEGMQLEHRAPGQFRESVGCYQRGLSGRLIKRSLKEIGQELAESLSAMANADGGTVLLGAEADGEGPGIFSSNKTYNIFMQALEKSAVPPLRFQVTPVEMEGRPLIKFTVDPSPAVHLLRNRKCYLRVGAQNVHISGERIALLKEARFETWHEREVLSKSSLEDLEGNLVADFIGHLGVQEEAEKILHRPYGLIEYREGKALLTRAAAYLFGKDALRWHARPGVEFVRFQGNERGAGNEYNVAERLRIEAPILRLIGEMEGIIGERIKERIVRRDLFFREKFEYPAFAWREALVNAIAHRDYSLEGGAVELWMFDDRLEVRSPGKLPGPVKIQQLLRQENVHYSRNPLITRVLTDRGIMRGSGYGLPQIFREMDHYGLNPPELKEQGNFCILVFRNTPILEDSALVWLQKFSGQALNLRQKRILAYARVHGMIFSSSDYQKVGVDRDTAYTEIRDLVNRGIVQPLRKRGKVYRLLEFDDQASSLPGLDWVKEIVEEKGFFTLQDVKQPKSVSRRKALEMIRELARQGYFTLSGKGRRIRYEPTDQLHLLLEEKKVRAKTYPGTKKQRRDAEHGNSS
jgi:ATP-dependent DNA helicase RecG